MTLVLALTWAPEAHPQLRVELLTIGPDPTIFGRFGHTALWVHGEGHDAVYNFGAARFDDPNLPLAFITGRAKFSVAVEPYGLTIRGYRAQDRTVYRQPLNLSQTEARHLLALLDQARRPYLYNHFRDNCATRPRDLIDRTIGGMLRKTLAARATTSSYRDIVRRGFSGMPWVQLGLEIILGRGVDQPLDSWEASFMPAQLKLGVTLVRHGGRPLAPPARLVYRRRGSDPLAGNPFGGLWLIASLCLMVSLLAALSVWQGRVRPRFTGLLLAGVGLVGMALAAAPWTLRLIALSPELRHNELVLLFWPTDLLLVGPGAAILLGRRHGGPLLRLYLGVRLAATLLAAALVAVGLFGQRPLLWPCLALLLFAPATLAVARLPSNHASASANGLPPTTKHVKMAP